MGRNGLKAELPLLKRQPPVVVAIATVCALAAGVTWFGFGQSWWGSLGLALLTMTLAIAVTRPLAVEFPVYSRTVGELSRVVLAHNTRAFVDRGGVAGPELWDLLVGIVCETLGVAATQVTPEAGLTRDLGVG